MQGLLAHLALTLPGVVHSALGPRNVHREGSHDEPVSTTTDDTRGNQVMIFEYKSLAYDREQDTEDIDRYIIGQSIYI